MKKSPIYNLRKKIIYKEKPLTITEAAKRLGVTIRHYQKMENGEVRISERIIKLLELGILNIPNNYKSLIRKNIENWNENLIKEENNNKN